MKKLELASEVWSIENFWSPEKCEKFIARSEKIGYEQAKVDTDKGAIVVESVRNNNRILHNDVELAKLVWDSAKEFAPQSIGLSMAIGLNELFRFYKYQPGQLFKRHSDQSFIRNQYEASYYTFMIYLNDGYQGGETRFENVVVNPRQGCGLIFLHSLPHEGAEVTQGIKYVLRTDIMYRLPESAD